MGAYTSAAGRERVWWTRAALVLLQPVAVFEELRDDSREAVEARQEPVLALVVLAGIAGTLATTYAGTLLDQQSLDAVDVTLWAFLGGALEGFALYFVLGAIVYVGGAVAGSTWSYRHARHTLAFAVVPLVVSLPVWAVAVAAGGGSPSSGCSSSPGAPGSSSSASARCTRGAGSGRPPPWRCRCSSRRSRCCGRTAFSDA
jgi:hypothetical protein